MFCPGYFRLSLDLCGVIMLLLLSDTFPNAGCLFSCCSFGQTGCWKGAFLLTLLEPSILGWIKLLLAVGENEDILFPLAILTGDGERIPGDGFESNPPTNGATLSTLLFRLSEFAPVSHGFEVHGET